MLALQPAVFLLGLFTARAFDLFFQTIDLAIEDAHGIDRFVDTFNEPLAFGIRELQVTNAHRNHDQRARQCPPCFAVFLGLFLLLDGAEFFFELRDFLVMFGNFIDLPSEVLQPRLHDFVGDLLFIEGHQFFDGADASLEVLSQRKDFLDYDRRAGKRLEHANLSALNALGNFHFAFAGEQRDRAHLAQVHTHRVVGFFQRARG